MVETGLRFATFPITHMGRWRDRIRASRPSTRPANRYKRVGRECAAFASSVGDPVGPCIWLGPAWCVTARGRLIAAYALALRAMAILATGPVRFTRPSFGSFCTSRPDGHPRIEGSRCLGGGSSPWLPTRARSPCSATRLASCSTRQSLQAQDRRCGWDATLQLDPVEARRATARVTVRAERDAVPERRRAVRSQDIRHLERYVPLRSSAIRVRIERSATTPVPRTTRQGARVPAWSCGWGVTRPRGRGDAQAGSARAHAEDRACRRAATRSGPPSGDLLRLPAGSVDSWPPSSPASG